MRRCAHLGTRPLETLILLGAWKEACKNAATCSLSTKDAGAGSEPISRWPCQDPPSKLRLGNGYITPITRAARHQCDGRPYKNRDGQGWGAFASRLLVSSRLLSALLAALDFKSTSAPATMIAGRFLTLLSTVLASVKFASADVVDARGLEERAADPCATIGGKTWVSPADVRARYQSFPRG